MHAHWPLREIQYVRRGAGGAAGEQPELRVRGARLIRRSRRGEMQIVGGSPTRASVTAAGGLRVDYTSVSGVYIHTHLALRERDHTTRCVGYVQPERS